MAYDFDLFVIGGGSGGVRCARIAGSHGARVGIAEGRYWGGTCVNVGCVPKKLLVQASEYGALAEDSHGFGWNTVPGTNDWAALIAAKDREIDRLNGAYERILGNAGVTMFEAFARFEDAHTLVLEPGPLDPDFEPRRVTAERIVIATGGKALVQPHIEGDDLGVVSDQVFHLPERPRRVTIVGGGYIGIEFAGIFAGLGSEVKLIYRQPLPLRGFDEDIRMALAEAIEERGIEIHPGKTLHKIERAGEARRVTLNDESGWETDLVLFAVGRVPNTDGLGLDGAGVGTDGQGRIAVNGKSETSVPGIFAIGDVSNKLNLTPVAIAEGHILAEQLFGDGQRSWDFDTTPKAVFFSPPVASVGLTEGEAVTRGPADIYLASFTPMRHALTGRKRKTTMKLVVEKSTQKLLGAHMLGDETPEMMQAIAVAITGGLTKTDFDRTIGLHPTSAEEFVTMRTITRSVP